MSRQETFGRAFDPERWSFTQRFAFFAGPPFRVDAPLSRGLGAIVSHLSRSHILQQLADDLADELEKDRIELEQHGRTAALGGHRYAALTDAIIAELYSALDGLRQVLFSIYRDVRAVQNDSTHKLFVRAIKQAYGVNFPEEIRQPLAHAAATWFPLLRLLRSENTHGQVGNCFLATDRIHVTYMHQGIRVGRGVLVIEDIVGTVSFLASSVSSLIEGISAFLYAQLLPVEREALCGTYKARMYVRMVAPVPNVTFGSGRCMSVNWFSKNIEYDCPEKDRCDAYQTPISADEFARLKPA